MKIHCTYDKLINIDELKPHPKNHNKHPKDQITRLASILEYQGWRYPVKVSNLSGFVTSGHGRIEAAKKNGWPEAPVNFQDYASEEQEYADVQSDNAIAAWADLDLSLIQKDIPDLGPDFDIDLLGIEGFELDTSDKYADKDEDSIPENVETTAKLGDIWRLGEHRLMCGDAMEIDSIDNLMDSKKSTLVFTDPPYGYKYESNYQETHQMLKNDDQILDFLPLAFAFMSENSVIYLCGSHQTSHVWRPLVDKTFQYKNTIVWKKNNWSMGDLQGAFAGQHELIFFAHKGRVNLKGGRSTDVWEFDRDPPKSHPTMKPVGLIEFAIEKSSDIKDVVMDLFGGSGSTLIACEKTNRKCYMMELEPKYCDVIIKRWEDFTDKKAELTNGKT